jgi:hypothetical protein
LKTLHPSIGTCGNWFAECAQCRSSVALTGASRADTGVDWGDEEKKGSEDGTQEDAQT